MRPASSVIRLAVAIGLVAPPLHAIENDCLDAYWSQSLRCRVFPNQAPQPIVPAPTSAAEIREYTRIDLPWNLDTGTGNLRCLDGTRPAIYVDPAVGADKGRWLISFTGGGSCWAEDLDENGSFESGQQCAAVYADPTERDEMGTAGEPPMKNLGNGGGTSDGIMRPDPLDNPVFAEYHRVRIEKCSYDRFNGRTTHAGLSALGPQDVPFQFTIHQQGQLIALAALELLRGTGGNGPSFQTWVPSGPGVTSVNVQLPSIADANRILLVGHSGGAHGLFHNADRFASFIRAWPGFEGDVRVIHDANFMPSAENESAFDVTPADRRPLFAQDYIGVSNVLGSYDAGAYYRDSFFTEQYRSYLAAPSDGLETLFDASCVASHAGAGDTWKCRDRAHVRFHHETTPALLREDYADPNAEHTNGGQGFLVTWGPLAAYAHCGTVVPFTPCPPIMAVGPGSPYQNRLTAQAIAYLGGIAVAGELAQGADTSGPAPTAFLWMPNCAEHGGVYDNVQYQESRMADATTGETYREFIERFVAAPAVGEVAGRVAGLPGTTVYCSQVILADSFE